MSGPLHLLSHGPDETREIGRVLGREAQAGDLFLLEGGLGAGKTCLTQGIAWGLGVEGYARSPTFVIITRYRGRLTLYHIDLFRIEGDQELWDLGIEEYFGGDGVCVIEWADRAPGVFPPERISIALEYGESETERLITITPADGGCEGHLEALRQLHGGPPDGRPVTSPPPPRKKGHVTGD